MEGSLLTTKLYIPPVRPNRVHRPRLLERLDDGVRLGRSLTLVSASAGAGKTTLLSEWAAAGALPFCWLSLDEDDNDPARFWTYVVAALQPVTPQAGQALAPILQGPQMPPVGAILTPLLNELSALQKFVVLVLDDYHLITLGPIHEGVAFLLEHLPPRLHLVLATRADPPLPIPRLRARGQLTELRAEDLRFTAGEVAGYLNGVMGLGLEPHDIAALESRTEGWISGLHLAALALRGRSNAHAFVEAFTGSHQYILEYLIAEVLSQQPEAVQGFLLQTSILDRLCAPLCDALTGEAHSAAMLARLQRDNIFTIPLDAEGRWYRYHHLFSDLLLKRLHQDRTSEQVAALHRRASRWYADAGVLDPAVKHAQAAGDFEQIAQIAESAAGDSLLDARLTTLLRWVDALPRDVLRAHPRLQIYRAWALYMNGHLEAAQQALAACRQTLEALPSSGSDPQRRALTRLLDVIEMIAQGFMCAMDNRIEAAIRLCNCARELALEDGHILLAAQATEGLALAQYHQGRLRASAQSCQQVLDLAARGATQAPLAAAGCVELAGIHLQWNELDRAARLLDEALALCRELGVIQTLNEIYTARSHLQQIRGDLAGAWEALEKAREFSSMEGDRSLVNFRWAVQQARLHMATGEADRARRWAEGMLAETASGPRLPAAFAGTLQITLARARLTLGQPEAALAVLAPRLSLAEAAGAGLHVIELSALQALALHALGDTAAALEALARSLALAEPEGFVRLYLNEGAPMAALLRQAVARGIHPTYVQKLLAALEAPACGREMPAAARAPSDGIPDPLTPRERDVLRCISQGLSNQEIAEALVIALNTVKRHTSSIYGKLDVQSRTRAVARARELGLLPTTDT